MHSAVEKTVDRVKEFHDRFYTSQILDQDEQGNDYGKISSLWVEDSNPQTVLDVGCGTGVVTAHLVACGHRVWGLDIQEEAVKRATARGIQAQVWDLNKTPLPFEDRKFDVVVATDVVEHVFDPEALLQEMGRILKDSGYALIGIPQHFDIIQRFRMLFGLGIVTAEHLAYSSNYRAWNYVHIRLFTLREAYELIETVRFRVEKQEWLPLPLFPYPAAIRAPLKLICNRFSRRIAPSLFSSGVRMRVRKQRVT